MRRSRRDSSVLINAPNKTDLTVLKSNGAARGVQSFTRATTATYIDDAGILQNVISGVPRFNNKGVLIEPVITNYLKYSNTFNNAAWLINQSTTVTINVNAINGPDNDTLSATELVSNSAVNDFIYQSISGISVGTALTASFFIKNGNSTASRFLYYRDTSISADIKINWSGSTLTSIIKPIGISANFVALANGWYHITIDFVTTQAINFFRLYPDYYNTGKKAYFYGSALTALNSTSYIPTTSATVTRNADILTIPAANFKTEQGKLKFDFTPVHSSYGTVALGGSYVDADNYTQLLHTSGTGYIFRKRIAGVNYDAVLNAAFVANTTYNIELRWSNVSGTDVFVNGVRGTNNPDKQIIQLSTLWQIGSDGNSLQQAGASFKNIVSLGKHPTVIDTKTYLTDENSVAITDENSNPIYTIL